MFGDQKSMRNRDVQLYKRVLYVMVTLGETKDNQITHTPTKVHVRPAIQDFFFDVMIPACIGTIRAREELVMINILHVKHAKQLHQVLTSRQL